MEKCQYNCFSPSCHSSPRRQHTQHCHRKCKWLGLILVLAILLSPLVPLKFYHLSFTSPWPSGDKAGKNDNAHPGNFLVIIVAIQWLDDIFPDIVYWSNKTQRHETQKRYVAYVLVGDNTDFLLLCNHYTSVPQYLYFKHKITQT